MLDQIIDKGNDILAATFTGDANVGVNAVVVGGDVFDGTSAGAMKISSRKGPDGSTEVTYRLALDLSMPMIGMIKRKGEKILIDTALKGLKQRVAALA